jgi:hypothetical protein
VTELAQCAQVIPATWWVVVSPAGAGAWAAVVLDACASVEQHEHEFSVVDSRFLLDSVIVDFPLN